MSNDSKPEIEIHLAPALEYEDERSMLGYLFFDGKKQATCELKTSYDFFAKPRKPKPRPRMIAYVLAYHLALHENGGGLKKAAARACEWLGISDERSIEKAVNDYPIPQNAIVMIYESPRGISVLLEPGNLKKGIGTRSYFGRIWDWKVGDKKATDFVSSFNNVDASSIKSPLKREK